MITPEDYNTPNEIEWVNRLVDGGITVHIRKHEDHSTLLKYMIQLKGDRSKHVIHGDIEAAQKMWVGGIHLKSHQTSGLLPTGWKRSISRSCHTLEELKQYEGKLDYAFLSPIYDSISKPGYGSNFAQTELQETLEKTNLPVIALGGITPEKFDDVQKMGFSGVAMLGGFWNASDNEKRQIINTFQEWNQKKAM